jgi:hypothetical protein
MRIPMSRIAAVAIINARTAALVLAVPALARLVTRIRDLYLAALLYRTLAADHDCNQVVRAIIA